ncbi:MAG: Hpt domain-containing protein [Gemmatimonadetes bacterium]|nr:MAG: Hpt domain-containing protein [Gemmatimonadota bacterium]
MSVLLDMDVINDLIELGDGDTEFITDLIQTFLTDAEETIPQLKAAIEAGDAEKIRRIAHSLKGASANIGGIGIAEVGEQIEQKGRDGDLAGVATLFEEFMHRYEQTQAELRQLNLI